MPQSNHGLTFELSDGSIADIVITDGGSDYTEATVSFSSGSAEAEAVIEDGEIVGITIIDPGTGYTTAPTITITGDGDDATATASIYKRIGKITNATNIFSVSVDVDDITNHDGTAKEYEPTLINQEAIEIEMLWIAGNYFIQTPRVKYAFRCTLWNGDTVVECPEAFITSYSRNTDINSVARATVSLQPNKPVTVTE